MYKDFYFEARNKKRQLMATFRRRWETEKYAEGKCCTVKKIEV